MSNENKTDYNKVKPNQKQVEQQKQESVTQAKRPEHKPVTQNATPRKKGLAERFVSGLVGPHGVRAIGSSISQNIVIPTLKKMLYDTLVTGASQAIFKDDRVPTQNTAWNQPAQRRGTNYNGQYRQPRRSTRTGTSNGPQQESYAPVEVGRTLPMYVIPDRNAATAVLDNMMDDLNQFGQVSLAAYLQLIGQDTTYNDYSLGWFDLADAFITPSRGGFVIELPQLEQIN